MKESLRVLTTTNQCNLQSVFLRSPASDADSHSASAADYTTDSPTAIGTYAGIPADIMTVPQPAIHTSKPCEETAPTSHSATFAILSTGIIVRISVGRTGRTGPSEEYPKYFRSVSASDVGTEADVRMRTVTVSVHLCTVTVSDSDSVRRGRFTIGARPLSRSVNVGGNWNNGSNAGVSYVNANNSLSNTNSNIGSRLNFGISIAVIPTLALARTTDCEHSVGTVNGKIGCNNEGQEAVA